MRNDTQSDSRRAERLFTGRQITAIVVAVSLAAIFMPVTVYAATGTGVNIVDKINSSYKARVESSGRLKTSVAGTVEARPAVPKTPFHRGAWFWQGTSTVAKIPQGKNIAISSLTAMGKGSNGPESVLEWRKAVNGSCDGATQVVGIVAGFDVINEGSVSGGPNVNWTHSFPVPSIRTATNTPLCLVYTAGVNGYLTVDGFLY